MTSEQDRNSTPVNLENINAYGVESYKKEYIQNLLAPLLDTPIKSVEELISQGNKITSQLNNLNGFQSVSLKFDVSNSKSVEVNALNEKLVNVIGTIEAVPLKKSALSVRTIHSDLDHAVELAYLNRNALGRGEFFQASSYLNFLNMTKNVDILASTPILDTSFRLFGHLNVSKTADKLFKSSSQAATSAELGFTRQKFCKHANSLSTISGGLNLVNRSINKIEDSANDEIKTYAGDSLKESVFFNLTSSNMKYLSKSNCTLPLNGYSLSLTNEIAGFPQLLDDSQVEQSLVGDRQDQYYKLCLGFDYAKPIFNNNLSVSSNLKFGSIFNLAKDETVNFQDKFYPKVSGHFNPVMPSKSIGAGSFLSYNFDAYTKVGFVDIKEPLRLYASVNGASSANVSNGLEKNEMLQLTKDWKHGLDFGLLYTNGNANAKLFWRKPIGISNDFGKFGFEVDINGQW